MYPKIKRALLVAVLLLCLIFVSTFPGTEGQLNFSTGWGKRSQSIQAGLSSIRCSPQGRPSLEQLLNLYNFIQIEAQKIADCQKLTT